MHDISKLTWSVVNGGYRRIPALHVTPNVFSMGRRLLRVLAIPAALLLYLALQGINVFRPVRVGSLNGKGRISIFISYIEGYLRRLNTLGPKRALVIIINPGPCPNEQASKMYGRVAWIVDGPHPWLRRLFSLTYDLMARLRSPMAAVLGGPDILKGYASEWQEASPVLRFTAREIEAGEFLRENMGMSKEDGFICFGLRDEAYYRQFLNAGVKVRGVNSEAEPETYVRNPLLANYLPMALRCAQGGLYVLRMGQAVGGRVAAGLHPNIIDYASNHRSPFGDIYLLAHCKFLVTGGAGGLWWIAAAFNRPVVMTDSYFMQVRPLRAGDLFIPKKIWHVSEKRFLSFREMLAAGMRYSYESHCRRDGVELVHNTAEEITAVADEMNQRLEGAWRSDEEDGDLQRRFNALYLPHHYGYGLPGRIGAQFLREHKHLLD